MSVKSSKEYTEWTATQRVSLLNGQIAGRKAKPYHVSFMTWYEQPPQSTTTWWDGRVSTGSGSRRGIDLNRLDKSSDFFYEPYDYPDAQGVSDAAVGRAFADLASKRDTAFNAAVAVAELPAAISMFVSTAKRIVLATGHLRKGDLQGTARALGVDAKGRIPKKDLVRDRASNYWLELQYGWMPLLSDVHAAAHKVASMQAVPRFNVRGRNTGYAKENYIAASGGRGTLYRELNVQVTYTYSVTNAFLAHASSFGLTNPMALAWELTPLSFVFDWLIPVGGWLQQFSAYHGLSFTDGAQTRKGTRIQAVSYDGSSQTLYRGIETSPGVYASAVDSTTVTTASLVYLRSQGFHRSPMVEFPDYRFPPMGLDASWRKLATSIALLIQRR